MLSWMNLNFQNPNCLNMFNLIMLNNFLILFMINIILFIIMMMKFNLKNKNTNKIMIENQIIEFIWTIIPMILIIIFMILSLNMLYLNNEMKFNQIIIKIYSNQWFWNYELMNFNKNFNSYLFLNNSFNFNLLETDNNLILPFNFQILFILTSLDVIHSWTLPSMNIKMDSIPNQLNKFYLMFMKPSLIYGQCSEICGINHSFMPIKLEVIKLKNFLKWI